MAKKPGPLAGSFGNTKYYYASDGTVVDENGKPAPAKFASIFGPPPSAEEKKSKREKIKQSLPKIKETFIKAETNVTGVPTRTFQRELVTSIEHTTKIVGNQEVLNVKLDELFSSFKNTLVQISKNQDQIVSSIILQNQIFQDKVIEAITGIRAPTRAAGTKTKISRSIGGTRTSPVPRVRSKTVAEQAAEKLAEKNIAEKASEGFKFSTLSVLKAAAAGGAVVGSVMAASEKQPYTGEGVAATGSAKEAIDFFVSKGWTREQAIALAANLQVESNFKTNAVGDGGRAYGIAQWHPDRQANFERVYGKPIRESTFKEQLEFVNWELNNTEKRAGERLRSTTDAATAAAIVDQYYERSSGAHRQRRVTLAQQYEKGDIPATPSGAEGAAKATSPRLPTTQIPSSVAQQSSGVSPRLPIPGASERASYPQPQSTTPPGAPSGGPKQREDSSGAANVSMTNGGATRSGPITPYLASAISQAVTEVYGAGARAEVYSGGQPPYPGGPRVGSTRHDNGMAADVYVYANGKKITGDDLGKLAQYWLSRGIGGVGLEMRGGGIHLDQHTDRARSWFYGNETAGARAAVYAGLRGETPSGMIASVERPAGTQQQARLPTASRQYAMQEELEQQRNRNVVFINNVNNNNIRTVYQNSAPVHRPDEGFSPFVVAAAAALGMTRRRGLF